MEIRAAYISEKGGREVNEDFVQISKLTDGVTVALADGLGGHGLGDEASRTAVQVADAEIKASGSLERAFEKAQEAVLDKQNRCRTKTKMKTTLCLLRIRDGRAEAGHVGDSRIYYFKNGKILKRTLDHSLPQMLVNAGEIKENEIRFHEDRNRVTRVIGTEWEEPQYEIEKEFIAKEKGLFGIKNRYAFLLCSDGWWELINEADMETALSSADSPEEWLLRMKERICENGKGKEMDNYTAAAVFVKND